MKPARTTVALCAVAALYLLPLRHYGLMLLDDGWYLDPVLRMLDGGVLYRDVWTFYAPLRHHLFEAVFALTGPSILVSRTVLALLLVAAVGLSHRVALRLAPAALAWLPALVYALVPGPWHKGFYGLCTAGFFLLFARALERPDRWRLGLAGAAAGLSLITRQDLGLIQLAIVLVGACFTALLPGSLGLGGVASVRLAAARSGIVAAAFALPVLPVVAYYAAHGAFGAWIDANFVAAFRQIGGHESGLARLLTPASFATADEGRGVALLMMAPLVLYPAIAALVGIRLVRGRLDRKTVLLAALLAYAAATLSQAYNPLRLLRFLQSALPFYLLCTWAIAEAGAAASRRLGRLALGGALAAGIALAGLQVWLVLAGVPIVMPGVIYTGSARMAELRAPVRILGDTVCVEPWMADDIATVRAFLASHAAPGEPIFGLPSHATYNLLLERPNPTRLLADHFREGEFVMSEAQMRAEMSALLASGTRYVLVDPAWYASPQPPGIYRTTFFEFFQPVRRLPNNLILERVEQPGTARLLTGLVRRALSGRSRPADRARLHELAARRPDDPIVWSTLAEFLGRSGDLAGATRALERVAELDPDDVWTRDRLAVLHQSAGRPAEAQRWARRAEALRRAMWADDPHVCDPLWERLTHGRL